MKLDQRRTEAFIANPGAARIVLLYGEDIGLAHDRANRLTVAVTGSLDDPFAVADIDRGSMDAIGAELSSVPMTGGRRVVRLRECGDFAVDSLRRGLAGGGGGLIVAEAGVLPPRSRLRIFVETFEEGVAIACYPPDSRAKAALLCETLSTADITIDEEALSWISVRSVDFSTAEREADKLVSYAGSSGRLTLEDVVACSGEAGAASLEQALFAATAGLIESCDRALSSAIADGVAGIQVVRAGLRHLHRLSAIRSAVNKGVSVREAAKSSGAPLPVRQTNTLEAGLTLWSGDRIEIVAEQLLRVERACKRTGAPVDILARYCVGRMSLEANARTKVRVS